MKILLITVILFFKIIKIHAQDSTLIGRFGIGILGSYSKTNIVEEKSNGGFGLQFRYFPSTKGAFVVSYQNTRSQIIRSGLTHKGFQSSLGFGFEKHVPYGNLSPYLGMEAGLIIAKVNSNLLKIAPNSEFFQNNFPSYLFRPKIGTLYKINDQLNAQFEATFNWTVQPDRKNLNPLYDGTTNPIYFGRKVPTLLVGVHYLFRD